ncbi:MAG: 30S ribosomal protein S21 [Desulfobacterota bacterium]|nr:30S ribosomal protein S21 [Thermodesulfobacteriota bacterium]
MEVKVYGNDVEKALKVLKRNLSKEGFFRELRERKHYEKPSVKRKKKQTAARKARQRMERRKAGL